MGQASCNFNNEIVRHKKKSGQGKQKDRTGFSKAETLRRRQIRRDKDASKNFDSE